MSGYRESLSLTSSVPGLPLGVVTLHGSIRLEVKGASSPSLLD